MRSARPIKRVGLLNYSPMPDWVTTNIGMSASEIGVDFRLARVDLKPKGTAQANRLLKLTTFTPTMLAERVSTIYQSSTQ
jgi:hypothetical protein